MSLLPSRAARIPGPSGSLCALFALLLLTPPRPVANAGPPALLRELRCQCLSITPAIPPRMVSNLEMIPAGPQCSKVELIATLKNGKEVCLDPEAPLIKKIIQKILSSGKKQKN